MDIGRRRGRFNSAAATATAAIAAHVHARSTLAAGRGTAVIRRWMSSYVLLTGLAGTTTHTGRLMLLLLRFGTASRLFHVRRFVLAVRDGDDRRRRRSIVDRDRLLFTAVAATVTVVYVTSAATVMMAAARSMMDAAATAAHHHAATAASIAASVGRRRMVNLYIARSAQTAATATISIATHRSGIDLLIVMVMMMASTATAGLLQLARL